ncbi:MAG: hypothetical protein RL088_2789 [Verrucomicrobiota bacterium]
MPIDRIANPFEALPAHALAKARRVCLKSAPMTTDPPPPRRKWHFKRWFIVLSIAIFAWSGWRVYDKRSAIKEARALGWQVEYTDPSEEIWADWRNAFRKRTWTAGVIRVEIPTSESFEGHIAIAHRLNPLNLFIQDASTLRNLSVVGSLTRLGMLVLWNCKALTSVDGLTNLSSLQYVALIDCEELATLDGLKNLPVLQVVELSGSSKLTNVDVIKSLPALSQVVFINCPRLTNVNSLKNLPSLKMIHLEACTGLTRESVDALRAALPNTTFHGP